jgi:hypothetical protein
MFFIEWIPDWNTIFLYALAPVGADEPPKAAKDFS